MVFTFFMTNRLISLFRFLAKCTKNSLKSVLANPFVRGIYYTIAFPSTATICWAAKVDRHSKMEGCCKVYDHAVFSGELGYGSYIGNYSTVVGRVGRFSSIAPHTTVVCGRHPYKEPNVTTPMIPNTIMWWILSAINRPIINAHLGLEAIGLFAVANKLSSAVSSLTQIFTSSWQVSVLQEYGKKDFSEFFNNIGRTFFVVLILLSCSMAVFSPFIIKVTVDSKFFEAWRFLPIISLAVVFNGLSSHAGTLFSATKTSKYFLYSSIAGAICSIVFNILLIPWIGLYGASISFTLSQVAIGLYRLYFANRIIKYKYLYQFAFLLLGNTGLLILIFFEKWIASYSLYLLIIGISIYFNRTYIISICKKCRLLFS